MWTQELDFSAMLPAELNRAVYSSKVRFHQLCRVDASMGDKYAYRTLGS